MLIKNLFERDIFRSINGVVKADQLDDTSIWQELDEFVVTREMDQHIRRFFSSYLDAIDHKNDTDIAGKIGIWVSGFFGSGKSHFIKVLSYLLFNRQVAVGGKSQRAVEFFEGKIKDPMFLGDIKRAVASNTDVILFNIDSKASHKTGRDAILQVFLKVLNEKQGYSPDHPHIAHMERHLDEKGTLQKFRDAFRAATGSDWLEERDAYEFNRDEVIQAFSAATGQSKDSSTKWIDNAESNFSLTVENFCKWVKEYLDAKSADHRLIFLVDEVGQFIGTDSHLMLNLQTITEELGVTCKGRAWIVVTSQEDIDAVLGEMKPPKSNDFSKITGRFKTRLSLSSANVDEVIQSRLLAKVPDVKAELETLFAQKGDIIKNQLTFTNIGMTLRPYRDADDFVRNYPFAPYQFQLMQKVFEAIRKAGATGLHLSRGERSILDAFQAAGKSVGLEEVGVLVPLYRFYPSIESFLDTAVKRTIDQAKDRNVEDFDIELLKALFLIRYVEEMKGNVDNLVTLCVDRIDADRLPGLLDDDHSDSAGRKWLTRCVQATRDHLKDARWFSFGWSGWRELAEPLRPDSVGRQERRVLRQLLDRDAVRARCLGLLCEPSVKAVYRSARGGDRSEQDRKVLIEAVLPAIVRGDCEEDRVIDLTIRLADAYEEVASHLETAFNCLLWGLTRQGGQAKPVEIEADKQLRPVFRSLCRQLPGAAQRLRDLIEKIPAVPEIADRNPLELLDVIASQAATGGESPTRLIEIVLARHRDVQASKHKGMWIEAGDRWTLMPGFGLASDGPPYAEAKYLHTFRVPNAYSFLADLGLSGVEVPDGEA